MWPVAESGAQSTQFDSQQWDIAVAHDHGSATQFTTFSLQGGRRFQPVSQVSVGPGVTIDRFVIEGKLGQGGTGAVWCARDTILDRQVAIKILLPRVMEIHGVTKSRERLIREAKAIARIDHPNIVKVLEVGTFEGIVYIAMEYMCGGTVREWLRSGRRTRSEVFSLFEQVAEGLQAAHDAGLVHRDVKPENILLNGVGRAVVSDFGLVSATELDTGGSQSILGSALAADVLQVTESCPVRGTPAYMSPEQFEGAHVDHRADQFAYAVSLFEALYGRRPFVLAGGLRDLNSAMNVIRQDGGLETAGPEFDVLLRALSFDAERRFSSMADLLVALRAQIARSAAPRGSRKRWLIVAPLVGAAVAVTASVLLLRQEPVVSVRAAVPSAPAKVTLRITSEPANAVVYRALDGVRVAHTPASIAVHRMAHGRAEYVVRHEGYQEAQVAFSTESDAHEHLVLASEPVIVAPAEVVMAKSSDERKRNKRRLQRARHRKAKARPSPAPPKPLASESKPRRLGLGEIVELPLRKK